MLKNFYYNCNKLGSIKNLEIQEIRQRSLKKNHVRVQIHAIGINYVDILMIKGKYQHKKKAPFTPGIEASGIILEENCNNKKLINKKVIITKKGGCFSEEIETNLDEIIIIPEKIDCALAAGSFVPYLTSYISLIETAKLKKNENILITGAAGGVGTASIKLAKSIGANVVAIVSNNKKRNFVKKAGSDKIILIDNKKLKNISHYRNKYKIDTVLDITGLIKSKNLLSFLNWKGKYIIVGFMNENFYHIPANYILIKGLSVFGVRAGEYLKRSKNKNKIIRNIIQMIKQDSINSFNYKIVNFNKLASCLNKLENRTSLGKNIVITKYYKKINL
tara:strand:+ start:469 stop:1467 length:999 start_codon:yes stop_codon:yes gene_type:complete